MLKSIITSYIEDVKIILSDSYRQLEDRTILLKQQIEDRNFPDEIEEVYYGEFDLSKELEDVEIYYPISSTRNKPGC